MKLILTQQVSGLGEPGDVIEVKDGYGRNYLVPRGFAIKWTRGAERQIESIKKARSAREIATVEHAKEVAGRLKSLKVTLRTRTGSNGRLFGAVTPPTSPRRSRPPTGRTWTAAGSRSVTRSRPSAPTGSASGCTPMSTPPSTWTSSRRDLSRPNGRGPVMGSRPFPVVRP